ncbi:GDNF-inducible zinc finger protein 1-like [Vanessa tameamea]|uniref:GDNF-inducible zinc finger protein 1-like n=1 Tax=Vanessa tameamea TaxID=334116 RepID=A0ABM4ASV0_VANTA|nr:GDNF-inducible zinc finger protein 1-like [Vanessa atalanta]
MAPIILKVETEAETCSICGGGGDLFTPEEHDAGAPPMQVPLRAMLLHINNNKVVPEGKLCVSCVRRAIEAYEFSTALSTRAMPPLSEKIRALRRRLHELTQKIDVFIVVGGPGVNSGGAYSEDDIIMVERDALAAAAAADDEDLEKARNACGETVYQCSICPMSFQQASEYRAHIAIHPGGARHSCWTCGAQFNSRDALRDHTTLHAAALSLVCQLCNVTCQSGAEMRRHEASCASCPLCALQCPSRAALAAHARRSHAEEPPLLCALCFRTLADRAAGAAHALAHRQAERFVCGYDACILRFSSRGDLLAHIRRSHARAEPAPTPEPPPTTCPTCGRTFGSVAAMKRHARVHRKEIQQESDWQIEGEAVETLDGMEGMEVLEGDVEYLEVEALDEFEEHDDKLHINMH